MNFEKPNWAALPLRLVMGIILVVTGYTKLSYMSNTITFFAKYGFPIPITTAWFIGSLEFFGGAALILGLLVRLLGILYTIEFIVASVWVALPASGYAQSRLLFMLIAGGLALSMLGAGPLSIDSLWVEKKGSSHQPVPKEPPLYQPSRLLGAGNISGRTSDGLAEGTPSQHS